MLRKHAVSTFPRRGRYLDADNGDFGPPGSRRIDATEEVATLGQGICLLHTRRVGVIARDRRGRAQSSVRGAGCCPSLSSVFSVQRLTECDAIVIIWVTFSTRMLVLSSHRLRRETRAQSSNRVATAQMKKGCISATLCIIGAPGRI